MNPKVTIIIPCYNHSKYIERAIQSVLDQDYDNIAISIVDDASTDNSFQVIRNLFTSIKLVDYTNEDGEKIIKGEIDYVPTSLIGFTKNQKQAAARNRAIKETWDCCEYYLTLDSDDILFPAKISRSMEVILEYPDRIGLVYSDAIIYNEMSGISTHEFRRPYDRSTLEQENIISNCSLISKKSLEKVGLYEEDLCPTEDWNQWLKITEHFTAVHIPEPLHQYTVTNQSCTFTVSEQKWNEQRQKVLERMEQRKK